MREVKVVQSVDIHASREHVFALLTDVEKRLRLSPVWEELKVDKLGPEPLQVGSLFHVHIRRNGEVDYLSQVVTFVPGQKITHQLSVERRTRVTWAVQDVPAGTRLIYEETFLANEHEEAFVRAVQENIQLYLSNIRQYAELHDGLATRLAKLLFDRFLLRISYRERQLVMLILILQGVFFISFACILLALGLAGLLR